jgi:hypothetical protein
MVLPGCHRNSNAGPWRVWSQKRLHESPVARSPAFVLQNTHATRVPVLEAIRFPRVAKLLPYLVLQYLYRATLGEASAPALHLQSIAPS